MNSPLRNAQIDTFLDVAEWGGSVRRPLAGDASFRRYERVTQAGRRAVLMDAPPEHEDVRPFLQVRAVLAGRGFSVPELYAADPLAGLLLLEDLGDDSFSAVLAAAREEERTLYLAATDALVQWARLGAQGFVAAALPPYDTARFMNEIALFCDWFLPAVAGRAKAQAMRTEFLAVWESLLTKAEFGAPVFVHRDYHADNLLWLPNRSGSARIGMLDFQDALIGPAAYDLVSILEDARRDVSPATVEAVLEHYIAAANVERDSFMAQYALLGAQRNSKIVGIFTRLAVRDGKAQYLSFLPRVWGHLARDVEHPALAPLKHWLDAHVPPQWRGAFTPIVESAAS